MVDLLKTYCWSVDLLLSHLQASQEVSWQANFHERRDISMVTVMLENKAR